MEDREMIAEACGAEGIVPTAEEWGVDEYGKAVAKLGRWHAIYDHDGGMFEAGDEGDLVAMVVGAAEHHNQRVIFSFTPDGMDSGEEVAPFVDVEVN